MQKFNVRIQYPQGLGVPALLSHKDRQEWSKRRAQQHAADIRAGKTGIRGFLRVSVIPA